MSQILLNRNEYSVYVTLYLSAENFINYKTACCHWCNNECVSLMLAEQVVWGVCSEHSVKPVFGWENKLSEKEIDRLRSLIAIKDVIE